MEFTDSKNLFEPNEANAWGRFFFMLLTFLTEGVRSSYTDPKMAKFGMNWGDLTHYQADLVISNFSYLLISPGPMPLGEFHDQGDAKWIVNRGQLRGHNDTPCGRPTHGRPIGRLGVGRSQGVFGGFSY
jgi:hypothetical protein